ncbi:MAG: class I SAM-dependent methyltransferase [Arcobacter sp.]|uniref:class I SAM-dependent methyltransferase n=1 Tax=uncultured Arcobacter sp. TaxID=165434 RepID=UPI000CA92B9A|nr:class I SAM-dependent methyltransferase [uncultured Arcobacter sp.]PLY10812.1 MAG: class I SAM-dependent methyltransferase [Arcobacter sp.]
MAQKDNTTFYKKSIKKYGISAKGVHWNSEFTQYMRFEILTRFIKKDIKNSSIIDAGCGFGEYYNYLFDNDLKPKSYIGIDCEQEMIKLASKRFLDTNFHIKNILYDELETADYYICSGALNILDKYEIFQFIHKCFNASTKAFIFNFLKDDPLTKVKVKDVLSYCKTLTKNMQIEENYLENDVSIILKK